MKIQLNLDSLSLSFSASLPESLFLVYFLLPLTVFKLKSFTWSNDISSISQFSWIKSTIHVALSGILELSSLWDRFSKPLGTKGILPSI